MYCYRRSNEESKKVPVVIPVKIEVYATGSVKLSGTIPKDVIQDFYVGCLGSRQRHLKFKDEFFEVHIICGSSKTNEERMFIVYGFIERFKKRCGVEIKISIS